MSYRISFIVLIFLSSTVKSQECVDFIDAFRIKMESMTSKNLVSPILLDYEVHIEFNDNRPGIKDRQSQRIKSYVYKGGFTIIHDALTIVCDNNYMYSLIPYSNKILKKRYDNSKSTSEESFLKNQNDLFASIIFEECSSVDLDGSPVKKIKYRPNQELNKSSGINSITYYYSLDEKRIVLVDFHYHDNSKIKRKTIEYHALTECKTQDIPFTVSDIVIPSSQKLNPKYASYEIISFEQ